MIELSPQQLRADELVQEFLAHPTRRIFRLDGFAGTGKTTILKHLLSAVSGKVLTSTFTGKAASVLRKKGVPACTGHSLIYRPKDKSEDRLDDLRMELSTIDQNDKEKVEWISEQIYLEKQNLLRPSWSLNWESELVGARLLAIDEHSMIDDPMGNDFMEFKTKVLALGDPAQLPPIGGKGFFLNMPVDITLTEIHRQAAESVIIQMATRVREGRGLIYGEWDDVEIKAKATDDDLLWADQILVGRNATRRMVNERVRSLLRRGSNALPVDGDKLVCLRNNNEKGLLNGTLWNVVGAPTFMGDKIGLKLIDDEGREVETIAWTFPFLNDDSGPVSFQRRRAADEFDFGYALTVHKSQGSQWDKVLVIDESSSFGDDKAKHQYTAITRAAQELKVTKG